MPQQWSTYVVHNLAHDLTSHELRHSAQGSLHHTTSGAKELAAT